MSNSVSAWEDTIGKTAPRRDPLIAMLLASFGSRTATIPLDDASAIVRVLWEHCPLEVVRAVHQTLDMALQYRTEAVPQTSVSHRCL